MRLFVFFLFIFTYSYSQENNNLLDLIDRKDDVKVINFFKDIKLINSHSVEFVDDKVLHFMIQHRFGPISNEGKNLWGLDESQIRFGLTYGLSDNLNIGIGRSSYEDIIDFFIKKNITKQSDFFFQSSFVGSLFLNQFTFAEQQAEDFLFNEKLSYSSQFLIARKFNKLLTLQLMPTLNLYNNILEDVQGNKQNNYFDYSVGLGSRFLITKSTTFNFEYYYLFSDLEKNNSFSFGFDIETRGHVFQFHFSNTKWMVEKGFINRLYSSEKELFFGFNISRVFNLN